MTDSTQRFSNRVEAYIRSRPGYPAALLERLREACGLTPDAVIADVGSGTGILSEIFLANGNPLFGVEPNEAMRAAAERLLAGYPRFTSVAATAEATTLPSGSVDFVTAGQAFHWFDRERARAEFVRILRPGGWVVLVWNDRRMGSTPFLEGYEQLLQRFGTDYEQVTHTNVSEEALARWFGPGWAVATFPSHQDFEWEGLKGRLLSSSYTPAPGPPEPPADAG